MIAKYKDDQWSVLEGWNHGRHSHGTITIGKQIMIVGGQTNKEYFLSYQNLSYEMMHDRDDDRKTT